MEEKKHAVVEIGSSALRLTVFGVKDGKLTFYKKFTRSEIIPISSKDILRGDYEKLIKIKIAIEKFTGFVKSLTDVREIHIFATQAIREVCETKAGKDIIKDFLPLDMKILSPKDEAKASYMAAYATVFLTGIAKKNNYNKIMIIDVGSSSTEIAEGSLDLKDTESLKTHSLIIKRDELERYLMKGEEAFVNFLTSKTASLEMPIKELSTAVIISGSKPTKAGWLIKGNGKFQKYTLSKAHGYKLTKTEVEDYKNDPPKSLSSVTHDTQNIYMDILFLDHFFDVLKINEAFMSSYGTRYGYAYQIAAKEMPGDIEEVSFL